MVIMAVCNASAQKSIVEDRMPDAHDRSRNNEGPYYDKDGRDMAFGGGTLLYGPDQDYYGVGHSSAYAFDGKLFFISHAYTKASDARAKLFIRPLSFRKGWIELGEA